MGGESLSGGDKSAFQHQKQRKQTQQQYADYEEEEEGARHGITLKAPPTVQVYSSKLTGMEKQREVDWIIGRKHEDGSRMRY